jgi:hypothetical protein
VIGGILRSVHRYASDAMVLTMLLHLLRHFAFDRMRGFRWFSWVTGVVLLWLVYAAGVNGYMLPWDRWPVRHPGQLRVAGLAAGLRRHADPQLHPARAASAIACSRCWSSSTSACRWRPCC